MNVRLVWATPEIDRQVMYMARVSNPANQNSGNTRLLYYCMENGHVSPFEMANACLEIDTTRDIGRQILRHRSFSFQEFSQRYATVDALPDAFEFRETRMQDPLNRQNSFVTEDPVTVDRWERLQREVFEQARAYYLSAVRAGIAKEQARALLPEGLTPSRLYMNGNMRSWVHYLQQRLDPGTQKEHRLIAEQCLAVLRGVAPVTMGAFFPQEAAPMAEGTRVWC